MPANRNTPPPTRSPYLLTPEEAAAVAVGRPSPEPIPDLPGRYAGKTRVEFLAEVFAGLRHLNNDGMRALAEWLVSTGASDFDEVAAARAEAWAAEVARREEAGQVEECRVIWPPSKQAMREIDERREKCAAWREANAEQLDALRDRYRTAPIAPLGDGPVERRYVWVGPDFGDAHGVGRSVREAFLATMEMLLRSYDPFDLDASTLEEWVGEVLERGTYVAVEFRPGTAMNFLDELGDGGETSAELERAAS